jgi:hypothetical protein
MTRKLSVLFFSLIATAGLAQKPLQPEKMLKLVPEHVEGYHETGDAKGSVIQLGSLQYSLCERKFQKGKEKIQFLLFDYKEAPIMYSQAMKRWNHESVATDAVVQQAISMENASGWETDNRLSNSSQISLGIANRYFLMISGDQMPLDKLKEAIVDWLAFAEFPN